MTAPPAEFALSRNDRLFAWLAAMRGEEGRLRLGTLNVVRWIALAGQAATVLFVRFSLGFELPLAECLAAIGAGVIFTLVLQFMYPAQRRPSDLAVFGYLVFDQTQLFVVLFLTGGLENPFTLILLAAVVIASSSLNLRYALALGAYTLGLITVLAIYHYPLPWEQGETLSLPSIYIAGIWIALMLGLGFTTIVTFRISSEATRMQAGLTAMELALMNEQKVAAIGSLAAAAAHELGTPLATIAVVAKELQRELPDGPLAEDAKLLRQQVDRCREILGRLAHHRGSDGEGPDARLPLLALLDDLAAPYRTLKVQITIEGAEDPPVVRVLPEMRYAIGNLIQNAADFARARVRVAAMWDSERVVVRVRDDGPGFATDVLARLGDPYVTTRPSPAALTDEQLGPAQPAQDQHAGMGLGFFIAKTLLERTGASMTFGNAFDGGASVTISWPRSRIEAADAA